MSQFGCTHEYVSIRPTVKETSDGDRFREISGMHMVCQHCGHQKKVWENGDIEMDERKEGKVTKIKMI